MEIISFLAYARSKTGDAGHLLSFDAPVTESSLL